MRYEDLRLNNETIGKYIEIDITKYDLKLVSRKMFNNKLLTVREFINSSEGALAGINGGLFDLYNSQKNLIGVAKDIDSNIDGIDTYGPNIAFLNDMLTEVWSKVNETNSDWFLSPAYYWFLRDNQYVSGDSMPGYENMINVKDTRSMIGQKSNGNIILAATTKSINGEQQAEVLKSLGCVNGANLDGGGSRQLIIKAENSSPIEIKRQVPNAILVFNKQSTDPKPTPTGKCTMKLFGSAARLRDNVVDGTEKILIPNGSEFEVVGLYSWKASDGYRWGYGKWGGKEGYFQYDPYVMMPLGNNLDTLNYKMRLFNSKANIREKPVNGTVITTVPNGSDITIIQFGKIKESDGYQWFQGSFNGKEGFIQYDPSVMFPTND